MTDPHLVISLDCGWFLAKNLSKCVSLPWKLHNQFCHSVQQTFSKTQCQMPCPSMGQKLSWTRPNCFGQDQTFRTRFKIWNSVFLGQVQNILDPSITVWNYKRIRNKEVCNGGVASSLLKSGENHYSFSIPLWFATRHYFLWKKRISYVMLGNERLCRFLTKKKTKKFYDAKLIFW